MDRTTRLIIQLSHGLRPIRRVAKPGPHAVLWLVLMFVVFGIVTVLRGVRPDLSGVFAQPEFALEWITALLTGTSAAISAFYTSIPGRAYWWPLLPFPAMAAWLLSFGYGMVLNWKTMGLAAFTLPESWLCVRFISVTTISLVLVLLIILRHAAHGRPYRSRLLLLRTKTSTIAFTGQHRSSFGMVAPS